MSRAANLRSRLDGRALGGRYELTDVIGSGGFADVYRAHDRQTETIVAVKVLHEHMTDDEEAVRRFIGEAQVASRLNEPHIVRILDTGEDGGIYYIAMELVQGKTLQKMVAERRRISPDEVVHFGCQALLGLEAAHAIGVIHRDVKPANLIVTSDGTLKVMDFGIAKSVVDGTMTRTGVLLGTPEYMAPEQISSITVDSRSDLYALSATLYELLIGAPPFKGQTPWATIAQHMMMTPRSPIEARPDTPPELSATLLRALEKKPADRFQSAREMIQALRASIADLPRPQPPLYSSASAPTTAPSGMPLTPTPSNTPLPSSSAPLTSLTPPPGWVTPPPSVFTPTPSRRLSEHGPATPQAAPALAEGPTSLPGALGEKTELAPSLADAADGRTELAASVLDVSADGSSATSIAQGSAGLVEAPTRPASPLEAPTSLGESGAAVLDAPTVLPDGRSGPGARTVPHTPSLTPPSLTPPRTPWPPPSQTPRGLAIPSASTTLRPTAAAPVLATREDMAAVRRGRGVFFVAVAACVVLLGVVGYMLFRPTPAPDLRGVVVDHVPTPAFDAPKPAVQPPAVTPVTGGTPAVGGPAASTGSAPAVVITPATPAATATPGAADRLAEATRLLDAGQTDRAIELLEALQSKDPGTPNLGETLARAYVARGRDAVARGDLDAADGAYDQALNVRADDPPARSGKRRVASARNWARMEAAWGKDDDAAIQALETIHRDDPEYRTADVIDKLYALLIGRAEARQKNGDGPGAVEALEAARALDASRPEVGARLTALTPTATAVPQAPVSAPRPNTPAQNVAPAKPQPSTPPQVAPAAPPTAAPRATRPPPKPGDPLGP